MLVVVLVVLLEPLPDFLGRTFLFGYFEFQLTVLCSANVTGININDYQLGRARLHTKRDNLEQLVDFAKGKNAF